MPCAPLASLRWMMALVAVVWGSSWIPAHRCVVRAHLDCSKTPWGGGSVTFVASERSRRRRAASAALPVPLVIISQNVAKRDVW
eukprot:4521902-Prymnesium_polylepis.2